MPTSPIPLLMYQSDSCEEDNKSDRGTAWRISDPERVSVSPTALDPISSAEGASGYAKGWLDWLDWCTPKPFTDSHCTRRLGAAGGAAVACNDSTSSREPEPVRLGLR